jgi:HD-GYP domain-containing protein (c-di-GMP phosphodiesterase class II)
MLLDGSGRVLCHPRLRKDPALRANDYSTQPIKIDGTSTMIALGDVESIRPRTATSGELSGKSALALICVPELGVTVLFHQPTETLALAGDRITSGLLAWSLVGGAGVIVLSVMGCIFLVSRYDSFHEQASTKLDHEVRRRTRQSLSIRNGLIFGLAKLAEERDNDTGKHLERIARYCTILAVRLRKSNPEIDAAWIERLALASSMHDIGKVGIPDGILLKQGPLTPEERVVMEKHTVIGAETLRQIRDRVGGDDLLTVAMQVTRHHHERWDGTGYPDKIEGHQIPLAARIIAIADVYDAITSKRVYKPAMSHEEAVEIIRSGAGKQYDPELVEIFMSVAGQFREACETLAPGRTGDTPQKTVQFIEPRPAGLQQRAGSVESVG